MKSIIVIFAALAAASAQFDGAWRYPHRIQPFEDDTGFPTSIIGLLQNALWGIRDFRPAPRPSCMERGMCCTRNGAYQIVCFSVNQQRPQIPELPPNLPIELPQRPIIIPVFDDEVPQENDGEEVVEEEDDEVPQEEEIVKEDDGATPAETEVTYPKDLTESTPDFVTPPYVQGTTIDLAAPKSEDYKDEEYEALGITKVPFTTVVGNVEEKAEEIDVTKAVEAEAPLENAEPTKEVEEVPEEDHEVTKAIETQTDAPVENAEPTKGEVDASENESKTKEAEADQPAEKEEPVA